MTFAAIGGDHLRRDQHIGWYFAVRSIEALLVPQPVALVVDSDLDALPAINRREQPYFANHLLPQSFTLVYASSDAGTTEFIANKAIATCDDFAAQILRKIEADSDAEQKYQIDPTLPFAKWRTWHLDLMS